MMRLKQWITAVALCGILIGCTQPDGLDVTGKPVHFKEHVQQWMVINYWAEWCPSCMEEIGELNALFRENFIPVFSYNADGLNAQQLRDLGHKYHIHYTQLLFDPRNALNLPASKGLPTTFLVAPGGQVIGPLEGPQTTDGIVELMGEWGAIPTSGEPKRQPDQTH